MSTVDNKKNSLLNNCFEWMALLIGALLTVAVVFAFFFRVVGVSGFSMCNTLQHNDRLVLITQFYTLERGDIAVICREGEEPLIKRVIAVEGDTIAINDARGRVLLNGEELTEPYVLGGYTPSCGFDRSYTVKKGEFFAMGDNRSDSLDSRQMGAFSLDDVAGKVAFRLFPLSSMGKI